MSTFEPINGNRHFEGRLEQFADGRLTLDLAAVKQSKKKGAPVAEGKVEITLANVEKANLVPEI